MKSALCCLLFSVALAGANAIRDQDRYSNGPRANGRYVSRDGDGVTYTYNQTRVQNLPNGVNIERESSSYTDNSIRRNNVTYSRVDNVVIGHNKTGSKREQIVDRKSWDRWDSDSDRSRSGINLKYTESTYTDNSINLNNVGFKDVRNVVVGSGNIVSKRDVVGDNGISAPDSDASSSAGRAKRGWWDVEVKYENKQYTNKSHNMSHVTNRDVKNVVNGSGNNVSKRHVKEQYAGGEAVDFRSNGEEGAPENALSRQKRGWVDVKAKYENTNYEDSALKKGSIFHIKFDHMNHVTNRDLKNVVNGSGTTVSK